MSGTDIFTRNNNSELKKGVFFNSWFYQMLLLLSHNSKEHDWLSKDRFMALQKPVMKVLKTFQIPWSLIEILLKPHNNFIQWQLNSNGHFWWTNKYQKKILAIYLFCWLLKINLQSSSLTLCRMLGWARGVNNLWISTE